MRASGGVAGVHQGVAVHADTPARRPQSEQGAAHPGQDGQQDTLFEAVLEGGKLFQGSPFVWVPMVATKRRTENAAFA